MRPVRSTPKQLPIAFPLVCIRRLEQSSQTEGRRQLFEGVSEQVSVFRFAPFAPVSLPSTALWRERLTLRPDSREKGQRRRRETEAGFCTGFRPSVSALRALASLVFLLNSNRAEGIFSRRARAVKPEHRSPTPLSSPPNESFGGVNTGRRPRENDRRIQALVFH
jgi:hypothetical protein